MASLGNKSYTSIVNAAGQFTNVNTTNLNTVDGNVDRDALIEHDLTVNNDVTVKNDLTVNDGGISVNGMLDGVQNIGLAVKNNVTGNSFSTTDQDVVNGQVTSNALVTTGTDGIRSNLSPPTAPVNPGKFLRESIVPANSWEDGNMGNSKHLVFTPSDFTVGNSLTTGASRTNFINIASTGNWANSAGGTFGNPLLVTYSDDTATNPTCLVATKLIPKGFNITEENSIEIHSQIPNPPQPQQQSIISVAIRTIDDPRQLGDAYVNINYRFNNPVRLRGLAGGGENAGTGTTMVILYINPRTELTSANGIFGATIEMNRC